MKKVPHLIGPIGPGWQIYAYCLCTYSELTVFWAINLFEIEFEEKEKEKEEDEKEKEEEEI